MVCTNVRHDFRVDDGGREYLVVCTYSPGHGPTTEVFVSIAKYAEAVAAQASAHVYVVRAKKDGGDE